MEDLIEKIKACKVAIALGGAGLLAAGVVGSQVLASPPAPADFPKIETSSSPAAEEEVEAQPEVTTILVDVKGAVVSEGLYELPVGSRVNDAIQAAGGLLETADKTAINLAQKLADEALVYVASQGENRSLLATAQPTAGGQASASGKVNLNTADLDQLQTITGIGAKRAQDIIAYRESSGGFTSVDDLKNVSGIGDKTLEKIREEVTVD